MFLTRVNKGNYSMDTGVLHIAENDSVTLCEKYEPYEILSGKYLQNLIGEENLNNYLKGICFGKYKNEKICKICLKRFKRQNVY